MQRSEEKKHPETCQKFTRHSSSSEKGSTSGEACFFCSKPESSGQPLCKASMFGGCPYPTVCYKLQDKLILAKLSAGDF